MKNILVFTNIGLRGTDELDDTEEFSGNVKKVLRNVHDQLMEIRAKYNCAPCLLGLQETGGYNTEIKPFFDKPTSTDDHLNRHFQQGHGKNGVATYCTNEIKPRPFPPVDDHNEICSTIFSFMNQRGKVTEAAHINVYRNIHCNHSRSIEETSKAVKLTIAKLRLAGIRKVIIEGDFNHDGHMDLGPGFREICHPDMFHKHNDATSKKFIDRIWVNFNDVGILEIRRTCENKVTGTDLELLGHKTICVWVGKKPQASKKQSIKTLSLHKLKNNIRGATADFHVNSNNDIDCSKDTIDQMIHEFANTINPKIEKAYVYRSFTCMAAGEKVLLNELEKTEQDIINGKKQNKTLCTAMNNIRKGLSDTNSTIKPTIQALGNKLENKISKLNPPDRDLGFKTVDKIFGNERGIECEKIKDLEQFKRIIMGVSNSGAVDASGLSLRVTKIILDNNCFLRRFRDILECCLCTGYFPDDWKIDIISFIYKNKGQRNDPANWRPITISSSFGKHFEKVIGYLISGLDDKNEDNHAYTSGKACMTAIVKTQTEFLEQKLKGEGLMPQGMKLVTIAKADDISGAFESVDHVLLEYIFETIFRNETRYKIKDIIRSYLTKSATVIDRDSTCTYHIAKTFADRSIPQGSLLSPLLWRLYDGIFSHLYVNCFEIVKNGDPSIVGISHVAYADDHLTIITFMVSVNRSNFYIGLKIAQICDCLVEMFMAATEQIGCGVNPLKSETIAPKAYVPFISLVNKTEKEPSNSFKWLGYFLFISDDLNLKFDEKKIIDHIKAIHKFRRQAYQYTNNIGIRWRIYQVFIAPFVELYLPLAIQHSIISITKVHMLQHESMAAALRLPRTVNREKLEEFLGERSIAEKAKRMATRVIKVLNLKKPSRNEVLGMCLRSGNAANNPTRKDDRESFTFRLFMFQEADIKDTNKVKFNVAKAKAWSHKVRLNIQKKTKR